MERIGRIFTDLTEKILIKSSSSVFIRSIRLIRVQSLLPLKIDLQAHVDRLTDSEENDRQHDRRNHRDQRPRLDRCENRRDRAYPCE